MLGKMILRVALIGVAALGLGACTTGYGYGGVFGGGSGYDGLQYSSTYDNYYGDPYGYRSVPYGYVGSGFGWSSGYYYPGNGVYVYDRYGGRRNWSAAQRGYWQNHGRPGGYPGYGRPGYGGPGRPDYTGRGRPGGISGAIGSSLAGVPQSGQSRRGYAGQGRRGGISGAIAGSLAGVPQVGQSRSDGFRGGRRWSGDRGRNQR